MSEWISVRDRLPELDHYGYSDDILFIVASDEEDPGIRVVSGWYENGTWYAYNNQLNCGDKVNEFDAVTHWAPLPELPEITEDDRMELCEWYMNGGADEESDNDRGEIIIYLGRPGEVELSRNQDNIYIDDIVGELPPEVGKAFRQTMKLLKEEPDNIRRNEKYADILDQNDRNWNAIEWADGTKPFRDNWRDDNCNYVVLENYPVSVIDELFNIMIDWRYENEDGGGFRLFSDREHIGLDGGEWIDAIDICNWTNVTDDNRLIFDLLKD